MPIAAQHIHLIGIQFSVAAVMMIITVIAHALVLDFVFKTVDKTTSYLKLRFFRFWRTLIVVGTVFIFFVSHISHIWLWAHLYLWIEGTEITSLEESLYFSTTTYTTLGYGDVTLHPDWRLLGSTEAFSGVILLGLSTAALFELLLRIYGTGRIPR